MSILGNKSKKLRVGVLRGGPSSEYSVSLNTGKHVLDALRAKPQYDTVDIYIDRNGAWHVAGIARPFERIFPHVDVVVNALHGAYGEDGRVQKLLESHRVPFTGTASLGSALGMNKPLAKKYFREHGLLVPEHFVIEKSAYSPQLVRKIAIDYPYLRFVKPANAGSGFGTSHVQKIATHVVTNAEELAQFEAAIAKAFEHSDSVLVEEHINGREATCAVIESTDGAAHALSPVEIVDLDSGARAEISAENIARIQRAALDAHQALGFRHYSNSDFILNRMGLYILESNSLPALEPAAPFGKSLARAELSLGDFLDHVIALAIR